MKKLRFTEDQTVFVLKQAELGTPEPRSLPYDVIFCTCRKKYGENSPSKLTYAAN